MIMWFLSFILFMWWITFINLLTYQPCIPGINTTWSWGMMFLMHFCTRFANILLRILTSMFIRDIGLYFFSFVVSYLVLELGWWWPHKMNLGGFPPLEFYEIVWGEVLVLLEMFGKIHLWNHQIQGFCLLGFFWLLLIISLGVMCLFRFSDSSWFIFGRLYVSRNLSISSRMSCLLAYWCLQYLFIILCISLVLVVISPLSFLILFIWVLSLFFLMSLIKS